MPGTCCPPLHDSRTIRPDAAEAVRCTCHAGGIRGTERCRAVLSSPSRMTLRVPNAGHPYRARIIGPAGGRDGNRHSASLASDDIIAASLGRIREQRPACRPGALGYVEVDAVGKVRIGRALRLAPVIVPFDFPLTALGQCCAPNF